MELDLRDLRYFETIARLQHLGKAAEQLHRSQPALTNCLRRLEAVCEAPLFERHGRGMRLTAAGEALMRWAQRVRVDTQEAQREVRAIGQGLSGHINIGIVPTAARFLLPRAARQLWKETPDVTLRTVVGLTNVLAPLLLAGEIELMVISEAHVDEGFDTEVLHDDHYVVAASSRHELFKKKATIKDLTRYRWALQAPGSPTRDWLDQTFDRHRLPPPKIQVETSMVLMLPTLIEQTGLLTFVSRQYLKERHEAPLQEIRIADTTMPRRLIAVYRRGTYVSAAARRLMALLKTAAAPGDTAG
jgi:DNA-binding transcriptional LysR family regulator